MTTAGRCSASSSRARNSTSPYRPDRLIRTILRSYTGLFSDYVSISERDLATLSGYSEDEVYTFLVALSRQGVLHYIPKKDIPRLHFLIRREG